MAERKGYTAHNVQLMRTDLNSAFSRDYFWYATKRGFHYFEDNVDHGYLSYLPSFDGQDFKLLVNNLTEEYREKSQTVNILDIGCGEGNFLADCSKEWGRKIKGFGIDLRPKIPWGNTGIKRGDIHDLNIFFTPNSMDIITSVRVLEYAADPWAVIKRAHKLLKPGGIAILSYVPFNMNKSKDNMYNAYEFDTKGAKRFAQYLKDVYKMEVTVVGGEFCNIAYRKTTDKLSLPLSYGRDIFHRNRILIGFDALQYTTAGYKFNLNQKKLFKIFPY